MSSLVEKGHYALFDFYCIYLVILFFLRYHETNKKLIIAHIDHGKVHMPTFTRNRYNLKGDEGASA